MYEMKLHIMHFTLRCVLRWSVEVELKKLVMSGVESDMRVSLIKLDLNGMTVVSQSMKIIRGVE